MKYMYKKMISLEINLIGVLHCQNIASCIVLVVIITCINAHLV